MTSRILIRHQDNESEVNFSILNLHSFRQSMNQANSEINHSFRTGFTLPELALVAIIVALLTAIVLPKFARMSVRMALESDGATIAALLRRARSEAVRRGIQVEVAFSRTRRRARVTANQVPISLHGDWAEGVTWHREIQIEHVNSSNATLKEVPEFSVSFAADGTTETGILKLLTSRGDARRINLQAPEGWARLESIGDAADPVDQAALERFYQQTLAKR